VTPVLKPTNYQPPAARTDEDWLLWLIKVLLLVELALTTYLAWTFRRAIGSLIDLLFEVDVDESATVGDGHPNADPTTTDFVSDLNEPLPPQASAADLRQQTDVLRALKQELDDAVDAAQAAIRRERAQSQPQPGKEST
jgi:hypothetical protein